MQTVQKKRIGEIGPNQKHFCMTFQLYEIKQKTSNKLLCRIVDETGIVDACFDQYIQHLKAGDVYSMKQLRSKVIDGHIKIYMMKDVIIQKQPIYIGFKDKANDISKKYYASRAELEQLEKNKQITNKTVKFIDQLNFEKSQKQLSKKSVSKESNKINNLQIKKQQSSPKKNKDKSYSNKSEKVIYIQKKKNNQLIEQQQEKNYHPKQPLKIKYKQKDGEKNNCQYNKLKSVINLIDHYVHVCVWVSDKNKTIIQDKYFKVLIADQSGSIQGEFNINTVLQGNQWYEMDNMIVKEIQGNQIILKESEITQIRVMMKSDGKTYNLQPC